MSAILNKIRKLLQVTLENGATQGEVENAMLMAQNLMAKHQVELGDIAIHKNDIIEDDFQEMRVSYEKARWVWDLLAIISMSHNCRTTRRLVLHPEKRKLVYVYKIVGFPEDVQMSSELTKQLVPIIRAIAFKKAKAQPKANFRVFYQSYVEGFLIGLNNKLHEAKKQKLELTTEERSAYQLIIVKKTDLVNEFMENKNLKAPKKATESKQDNKALWDGWKDGQEFRELNKRLD